MKNFKHYTRYYLRYHADSVLLALLRAWAMVESFFVKAKPADYSQKYSLFVRVDVLGDFVVWAQSAVSAANHLKACGHKIIIIVRLEEVAALARELGVFDEIIVVSKNSIKSFIRRIKLYYKLRKLSYEYLFCIMRTDSYFTGDCYARVLNARHKYCLNWPIKNDAEQKIVNRIYDKEYPLKDWHTMEINSDSKFFGDTLGIQVQCKFPLLGKQYVRSEQNKYFVMFPFSRAKKRTWEWKKFLEVANEITRQYGLRCLICCSKSDKIPDIEVVQANKLIQVHSGTLKFPQIVEKIANAEFVICNDSGPLHLSIALGTKVFPIVHGQAYEQFVDYSSACDIGNISEPLFAQEECFPCCSKCTRKLSESGVFPCLHAICAQEVIERICRYYSHVH